MQIRSLSNYSGFTLVEVLVGVMVFSLLATICYAGLNSLIESSAVQRERSIAFAELQRTIASLDRDLRQLTHRPVRQPDQSVSPALLGGTIQLTATRAGWNNPAGQPRSQLQRFRWAWQQDSLVRSYWPVTDSIDPIPTVPHHRLTGVQGFSLRYRDQQGQWHQEWPVDGRMASLPLAIEVRLSSERFGNIRRLITLQ